MNGILERMLAEEVEELEAREVRPMVAEVELVEEEDIMAEVEAKSQEAKLEKADASFITTHNQRLSRVERNQSTN